MNEFEFNLSGAWVVFKDHWSDVTETLGIPAEDGGRHILLQKEDGSGLIQISVKRWRYRLRMGNLRGFLMDLVEKCTPRKPFDYFERSKPTMIAAASFLDGDDDVFTRVWYCSDGKTMALISYCPQDDAEPRQEIIDDCQWMAEQMWFGPDDAGTIEPEEDEDDDDDAGGGDGAFGRN